VPGGIKSLKSISTDLPTRLGMPDDSVPFEMEQPPCVPRFEVTLKREPITLLCSPHTAAEAAVRLEKKARNRAE